MRSHERVPRKRSAGRAGEGRPWVAGASERRRAEARIGVGFPDALACGLFIFFFFWSEDSRACLQAVGVTRWGERWLHCSET